MSGNDNRLLFLSPLEDRFSASRDQPRASPLQSPRTSLQADFGPALFFVRSARLSRVNDRLDRFKFVEGRTDASSGAEFYSRGFIVRPVPKLFTDNAITRRQSPLCGSNVNAGNAMLALLFFSTSCLLISRCSGIIKRKGKLQIAPLRRSGRDSHEVLYSDINSAGEPSERHFESVRSHYRLLFGASRDAIRCRVCHASIYFRDSFVPRHA